MSGEDESVMAAIKMAETALDMSVKSAKYAAEATAAFCRMKEICDDTSDMLKRSQDRERKLLVDLHECEIERDEYKRKLARLEDTEAQWKRGGLS